MVKYIAVMEPLDCKPVAMEPDGSFNSVSIQANIKQHEVPDPIFIEYNNEIGFGANWIQGLKVCLKFRWKGNQYYHYLTHKEYDYIVDSVDITAGVYHLAKPFFEMLQEDHIEVLHYFLREIAKIDKDIDAKKLIWLAKHDGEDTIYSDNGKLMGGYVKDPDEIKYHEYYNSYIYEPSLASETESEISAKSRQLPGMDTIVDLPCGCEYLYKLQSGIPVDPTAWRVVQHLNDRHRWSREKIADWLDELHDSGKINIEFDTPEGLKDE